MLSSPTCVSFSTDCRELPRSFSWQTFRVLHSPLSLRPLWNHGSGFSWNPSSGADWHFQSPATLPVCVPPSVKRSLASTGILTRYPSTTPFGLALGSDLPWADLPSPGNLRFAAKKILTSFIATHAGIITTASSSRPSGRPSTYSGTLPYPCQYPAGYRQAAASVPSLSPVNFRRRITRLVSYYALFK